MATMERPRDALPGIPYKLERVSQEAVWSVVCKTEMDYLRNRLENPPKGTDEMGRLAGFEVVARPTYTEVRRVYNQPGFPETDEQRTRPTGRIATLVSKRPPTPTAEAAGGGGLKKNGGTSAPAAAAASLLKTKSTPTLKDLIDLRSRSISHEALSFVYKYFSEDHMAEKERAKGTRGGAAAPIPRAGKAVVAGDNAGQTTLLGGAASAPTLPIGDSATAEGGGGGGGPGTQQPRSVSRGVQCENRKVAKRDALMGNN